MCLFAPASAGVLCTECRADLAEGLVLAQEQVVGKSLAPTRSVLVDMWGRAHPLDPRCTIGRDLVADSGLAIHEGSVSRVHARLLLDAGTWTVADAESTNGTFVEDRQLTAPHVLHTGDRVRFGQVGFYFLEDLADAPVTALDSETVRFGDAGATQPLPVEPQPRWSHYRLHEPTGGGGGIIEIDGKHIQLTLAQLELVTVLAERMEAEVERVPDVRGYVSVPELLGKISLEVSLPRDAHVRQLIRRVRRAFIKVGLGELIESRYGLGYRIRLIKGRR